MYRSDQTAQSPLFLGDSLTMRNDWSEFGAINMGMDGDSTGDLLQRLHLVPQSQTVVLMIGINDILNRIPIKKIQSNYKKILATFTNSQELYILSLLPLIDHPQTTAMNQEVIKINGWLKAASQVYGFHFIDLYSHFLDASKKGLNESFTDDGIHLTQDGYKVWERFLKTLKHNQSK